MSPTGTPPPLVRRPRNAASLRLHDGQGSVEVLRSPVLLGEGLAGGEGLLLRRDGA